MAATRIPPPPLTTEDKSVWATWYISIRNAINKLGASIAWSLLDFTGSNITDILTRNHNDLQSLQGGSTTERYHLTAAEYADIGDIGSGNGQNGRGIFDRSIGEMYITNGSVTVTVGSANTAYEITTGFTEGITENTTFGSSHFIAVGEDGTYKIAWSLSIDASTVADQIEGGFMVGGTAQSNATAHTTVGVADAAGTISAVGLVVLTAGDEISLFVRNHTAGRDITVEHASLVVERIL